MVLTNPANLPLQPGPGMDALSGIVTQMGLNGTEMINLSDPMRLVGLPIAAKSPVSINSLGEDKFRVVMTIQQMVEFLDQYGGWEAAFAPMIKSGGFLVVVIEKDIFKGVIMEPLPEGGVPGSVRHYSERSYHAAQRFGIKMECTLDSLNTERGRNVFQHMLRQMASSAFTRARIELHKAIVTTKMAYADMVKGYLMRQMPQTILEATQLEREMAFHLDFHDLGLAIASRFADFAGVVVGVVYDSYVLPFGKLSALSLMPYSTEAFRNGNPAATNNRIVNGAAAMPGYQTSKTPYEARPAAYDNDFGQIYTPFVMEGQFGQYYLLDGSDMDRLDGLNRYNRKQCMSIEIADYRKGWAQKGLKELIRQNMRFDPYSGELSEHMRNFIDYLGSLSRNVPLSPTNHVDPYVTWDDVDGTFHLVEFFGDVDPEYWTHEQSVAFGRIAKLAMTEDGILDSETLSGLSKLHALENLLNSYNPNEPLIAAYMNKVMTDQRNASADGVILNGNHHGCVYPPIVSVGQNGVLQYTVDNTRAVSYPYGFGHIAGLRTLADLGNQGPRAGWPMDILNDAKKAVAAADRIAEWMLSKFPENVFSRHDYCPPWMSTGDRKADAINAIIYNLLQLHAYPIYAHANVLPVNVAVFNANDFLFSGDPMEPVVARIIVSLATLDYDLLPSNYHREKIQGATKNFIAIVRKIFALGIQIAGHNDVANLMVVATAAGLVADTPDANLFFNILELVNKMDFDVDDLHLDKKTVERWQANRRHGATALGKRPLGQTENVGKGQNNVGVNLRLTINNGWWIRTQPNNGTDRTTAHDPHTLTRGLSHGRRQYAQARIGKKQRTSDTSGADTRVPYQEFGRAIDDPFVETFRDVPGQQGTVEVVLKEQFLNRMHFIETNEKDPITRALCMMCLFSYVHRNNLDCWIDSGIPLPLGSCQLLVQPWARVLGDGILWFQKGEPGFSSMTFTKYTATNDADHQMFSGTLTAWILSVIVDEKKFLIQPFAACRGYRGGYDDSTFTDASDRSFLQGKPSHSMFVFDCGSNFSASKCPNPISLSGVQSPEFFPLANINPQNLADTSKPTHPSSLFYNSVWGYNTIQSVAPNHTTFDSVKTSKYVNMTCFTNNQREWNPSERKFILNRRGTGHLSKFLPPFDAVLNGNKVYTENPALSVRITGN